MMNMISRLLGILQQYEKLMLPLGILVSVALCFFGYKYLKVWVSAFVFVGGFGGGWLISSQLLSEGSYAPILIGLLTGVVCVLITFLAANIGVFLLCASLAGFTVFTLPLMAKVRALYMPGELGGQMVAALPFLIALVVGVAAGVIALKKTRIIVIVVTGITGAFKAVMWFTSMMGIYMAPDTRNIWYAVIILLAALGMVVQNYTAK